MEIWCWIGRGMILVPALGVVGVLIAAAYGFGREVIDTVRTEGVWPTAIFLVVLTALVSAIFWWGKLAQFLMSRCT